MSFILEALKKSEKQQQKKNGRVIRTVHEPAPGKGKSSRFRGIGFLILLLVNIAALLWFFSPWQSASPSTELKEQLVSASQKNVATDHTIPAAVSAPVKQDDRVSETRSLQSVPTKPQRAVKSLPVPRNEKKVYLLSQLPLSIQKRLPTLKMSLHAFNRDQSSASLVQLNDRILREGDSVTDRIHLEKITADGVVLRYDGYRFLLPRRGNK